MKLPDVMYLVLGDFGPLGIGSPDVVDTLDAAADELAGVERRTGGDGQVLEINTISGTNRYVTAACISILRKRMHERWGEEYRGAAE